MNHKHDIKHYGTFGSPKIAKHVKFDQNSTWERVCERHLDPGNIHGIVQGN